HNILAVWYNEPEREGQPFPVGCRFGGAGPCRGDLSLRAFWKRKTGGIMRTLSYLNFVLAAVFAACYCYQAVFALVRLLGKRRHYQARKLCRYGVLIAARNEEAVIGQLIESIWGQDYPRDLVDVYVVADNCTDNTAQVA